MKRGGRLANQDDVVQTIAGSHRGGRLKIYVGAAPGVGKTYTMMRQAKDLKNQGVDVVVGYYQFHNLHNRSETLALMAGLEVIPPRLIEFRGHRFEEVDVQAIKRRKPDVAVIDELAHSNVPGSERAKRYMDVEDVLDSGIDVMTAVNIQHLESVAEEAGAIIGIPVREIVPKAFLDRADEWELIDVTPETIRRRLADGLIYPPEQVESALTHYFRYENLSALRELALREVAQEVDERLLATHDRRRIPGPVGARENVLVCVHFVDRAEQLIRIGARMAERMSGDLVVLTVMPSSQLEDGREESATVRTCKMLAQQYNARFVAEPLNDRVLGAAIADVAQRFNVTQIVIGQPRPRQRWRRLVEGDPVAYLLRHLQFTDLRIVGWRERQA
ncbi:MAG: histidine kinase [Sulfobacillus acidophilus]|uniref:Histidine kinase n=1 Tax=Sulfobacillus acidophilus TaxID=53633 RepID=A0A2T2WHG3_9FIRM|nr:MAG: histidine kinase [Sulfobacillus acidophilus]